MKDSHVLAYRFREAAQGVDSIDQHVTRLGVLSKNCDFPNIDVAIRAQILHLTTPWNFEAPQLGALRYISRS